MEQLQLITGYFRCANCGRDVERTQKTRRWRLCDECWKQIMPDWGQEVVKDRDPAWIGDTEDRRGKIRQYWSWYWEMEKQHPSRRVSGAAHYLSFRNQAIARTSDDYYPFCECGNLREPLGFGEPGLFGGPFATYCPKCKARGEVEAFYRLSKAIHPDWDDEDWLDALYKISPEAFAVGVLPDYWFVISRKGA